MAVTEEILRWRMRRGVLELDHIFKTFMDAHYSSLSEAEKESLVALLECQDPFLLDWLLYRHSMPEEPKLQDAVALITGDL